MASNKRFGSNAVWNALEPRVGGLDESGAIYGLSGVDELDGPPSRLLVGDTEGAAEPLGTESPAPVATVEASGSEPQSRDDFGASPAGAETLRANVTGTNGDDILDGTAEADVINGLDGNDVIRGLGGADVIDGGAGDDTIDPGAGNDQVNGGSGTDTLSITSHNINIDLRSGAVLTQAGKSSGYTSNKTLTSIENVQATGEDLGSDGITRPTVSVTGNDSANVLTVSSFGAASVSGEGGNDVLTASGRTIALAGGDGDDVLKGSVSAFSAGNYGSISGGAGDDVIDATGNIYYLENFGNNAMRSYVTLDGGAGFDTISHSASTFGVRGSFVGSTNIERLLGSSFDDSLVGDAAANIIDGAGGMDMIFGGDGDDELHGGSGIDTLFGGAGSDRLFGGADSDTLQGDGGENFLDGGSGGDTAVYAGLRGSYVITYGEGFITIAGPNGIDTLVNVERAKFADMEIVFAVVPPSDADDELRGTNADDEIRGLGGNDRIEGLAGNDLLDGGTGNDRLRGGLGNDVLLGGDGSDDIDGEGGDDFIIGGAGDDRLNGGDGRDVVSYETLVGGGITFESPFGEYVTSANGGRDYLYSIEVLVGSNFADVIYARGEAYGLAGDDRMFGSGGTDTLYGGAGNDELDGGLGNDVLRGEAGDDVLRGGGTGRFDTSGSVDNLDGGEGADTLFGDTGDDLLQGGAGDDILNGGLDRDALRGGDGDDTVRGDEGDDTIFADAGSDFLDGGFGAFDLLVIESPLATTIDLAITGPQNTRSSGVDTIVNIEGVTGGAGDDLLFGNATVNRLSGGAGADRLFGRAGDDVLAGEAGDDQLDGGTGDDVLDGGAGRDLVSYADASAGLVIDLTVTTAQNMGALGLDTLIGIEDVVGSNFADRIIGDLRANRLFGMGGDDVLEGGRGADVLDGGEGVDTVVYASNGRGVIIDLSAQAADDGLNRDEFASIENAIGSAFDDTLYSSAGANRLDGGGGFDTVDYRNSIGGVIFDLTAQLTFDGRVQDQLASIEGAIGSAFDDVFFGSDRDELFEGLRGADRINGYGGSDTVSFRSSTSGVIVDLAAQLTSDGFELDVLSGIENAIGSAFADIFFGDDGDNVFEGGLGEDRIDGYGGSDTVSFRSSTRGVIVDLAAQASVDGFNRDVFTSIENVIGSAFDDTLYGGVGVNRLDGGAGSDTINMRNAQQGVFVDLGAQATLDGVDQDILVSIENAVGSFFDDVFFGNAGDNVFEGGLGVDRINGGDGTDTVAFSTATQGVIVDLAAQRTFDGVNQDILTSIEGAIGSAFADTFYGSEGDDIFEGGLGSDQIHGFGGKDTVSFKSATQGVIIDLTAQATTDGFNQDSLSSIENAIGSAFADTIYGDAGANVLTGGGGADFLYGRGGADRFVFTAVSDSSSGAADRILDFSLAQGDRVDLSRIDADAGLAGDQAFSFVSAFTGVAGEAVLSFDGASATTTLRLDVNGDGAADFELLINGNVTGAAFVL